MDDIKENKKAPEKASRCLQVLGHPIRLMMIEAMRSGEKTVSELEEFAGSSQSNISQHLRLMRDREILVSRKEGNKVYYNVSDERIFKVLDAVKEIFCKV